MNIREQRRLAHAQFSAYYVISNLTNDLHNLTGYLHYRLQCTVRVFKISPGLIADVLNF